MRRSVSVLLAYMLGLIICLAIIELIHDRYYFAANDSPMIRVKTIFLMVAGSLIMKSLLSPAGFRLFLVAYGIVWIIYYGLSFLSTHGSYTEVFGDALVFYKKLGLISTPLPFFFFWLFDQVFLGEEKK